MRVFDFLVRKQRHIEALVDEYLDQWNECIQQFHKAMDVYFEDGVREEFAYAVRQTHRMESVADDLRRAIQQLMYAKALLPESRRDIMTFLDKIDQVINRAETALFIILNERAEVPPSLLREFRNLVDKSVVSTQSLLEVARQIFTHSPDLARIVKDIDQKESECDDIERTLIAKIFRSDDIEPMQRILLRDLILKLGDISDQAQHSANWIHIMSIKRRV
jgi:uncharacterized protein